MPTPFLTAPFGAPEDAKFEFGGLDKLYLAKFASVASMTTVAGVNGTPKAVTAITMASGETFVEIGFVDAGNTLMLQRKVMALVKRKNGKFYLVGATDGLRPASGSADSGAKDEDDSVMTFSFAGGNRGFAVEVTMTQTAIDAITTGIEE